MEYINNHQYEKLGEEIAKILLRLLKPDLA